MFRTLLAGALLLVSSSAIAHSSDPYRADGHAPIGVMGDHVHQRGEFMASLRYMPMWMSGLRDGTQTLDDSAALAVPNPFAGAPGQPPLMRILPRDMRMDMFMLGAMYGVSDRITLMGMGMFQNRSMTLETHSPPGASIGTFETGASGFSGGSVSALIRLSGGEVRSHLILGAGVPGGSLDATGEALLPNGVQREVRLPYAMQVGKGSFDARPGIVIQTRRGAFTVGGQVRGTIRLNDNAQEYRLGNEALVTGWFMAQATPAVAFSARLEAAAMEAIDGQDPMIAGPVPTADPANYGGSRITGYLGLNLAGQRGALREHRLGVEVGYPLHQDLNGPQMERTWVLMLGWQRAWSLMP